MPVLMEFQTIQENIDFAVKYQFEFIELNMNFLYCYPSEHVRKILIQANKNHGLEFSFHYYDNVDISSPNNNYITYLKQDLHLNGKTFKDIIDKIVLHIEPGSFMTIFSEKHYVYKYDANYVERTIKNLNEFKNILNRYDIEIVLENVPLHPFMGPLFKALGQHNFSFTWYIGHDVIYDHYLFSSFRKKRSLSSRIASRFSSVLRFNVL